MVIYLEWFLVSGIFLRTNEEWGCCTRVQDSEIDVAWEQLVVPVQAAVL